MSRNKKIDTENTFTSHLIELRSRLIKTFVFFIFFFLISYYFAEYIYGFSGKTHFRSRYSSGLERRLIFTALHEAFFNIP